jgi:RND family efflux transporter MFP subunit
MDHKKQHHLCHRKETMIGTGSCRWFPAVFAILGLLLPGCGSSSPPVADVPPPPVTVSKPVVEKVINYDDYEGRIEAKPKVDVRAKVRGHLKKVNFVEGEMVKEGQLLYLIDPAQYEAALDAAKALVKAADASLEYAEAEYERTRELYAKKSASRSELDVWKSKQSTARADRLKALAEVKKTKDDLKHTRIEAPINGRIGKTLVDKGNLVNAGGGDTLLATIVSVDPIYVKFNVDENSLMRYKQMDLSNGNSKGKEKSIKELKISVKVGLEGEIGYPHKGVIDFVDNQLNPNTATFQARAVLDNPVEHGRRLFDDGMRARVEVPVGSRYKAVLVSERAIGSEQKRKFVFVVNNQNIVKQRDVTLGRKFEDLQVIETGLKGNEWVVSNGIQRVRDGMEVKPTRAPMPGTKK